MLYKGIFGEPKPEYQTVSGPVASFVTKRAAPLRSLNVNIDPVQAGSGDPSPDNVRPISGWSAVNVWRTGKNLLPTLSNTTIAGITYMVNDDGSILINGTSTSSAIAYFATAGTAVNSLLESGTYTLSTFNTGITGEAYLQVTARSKDTGGVTNRHRITPSTPIRTFTISDSEYVGDFFIRLSTGAVATNAIIYPQIELGSTATPYEPYSGTQYTIQLGHTVYGGTLDVTNGVLTVTHGYIASYAGETLPGAWISDRDVYVPGTTPTIGAQVVYELDTPITIQLTPTQISTLQGANNIWADTGDVTVTYRSN